MVSFSEFDVGDDASDTFSMLASFFTFLPNLHHTPQILALHGIGQVRALRIFTVRNAGAAFDSLQDFADCVYMNDYVLQRFLKANAASIML